MKNFYKQTSCAALAATVFLLALATPSTRAQWGPAPVPTTRTAQANAIASVRSQVGWLQNATRSASRSGADPAGMLAERFNMVRSAYSAFTMTVNPDQAARGANQLAELAGGLDIIGEAFA